MSNDQHHNDRLLDHAYDGIQEYDNPLPRWWVWIFYATIVFAVLYYFDFTTRIRGPGRVKEYEQQMAEAAKRWPAPAGPIDESALLALTKDQQALALGKATFTTNCVACHRADAGGLIGPNLTDEYWIHGGSLASIYKTVDGGVLEKGMPNWGKLLKPEQVRSVVAYVASLKGSNPPNPKAPQGVKE